MTTRQTGFAAEQTALEFLQSAGLTLVERNFSCRLGEIDLVMSDSNTLVFVEVRLRNDSRYGTGAETVTWQKRKKLIKTAQFYLLKHPLPNNLNCRFDVISMDDRIDWIENAFTLDC
ncbi:MAG: YraN family protein [bacterium]|nr:YraN family protein [Gammaproteobacteria bacterium]HIL94981.1 YraN family protein [Pseudomonadales bacterium]